jgi:Mrp family chromosome partitioning ATPase
MIAGATVAAQGLRESLGQLLDPVDDSRPRPPGRRSTESLGELPFDAPFMDRCRLALSGLLGLEDDGVIEVSSPRRKDGRSSVAAALAVVLARTRARGGVLLLDLDFARAAQADLFSIAPAPGLADYLEGRERLRGVAAGSDRQLWVIPAGSHLGDPLRILHLLLSEQMLSVFRERFQWVVLDLPPLLGNPEVAGLAGRANWHVLVGRHRHTSIAELKKARELVGAGADTAGFVMTGDASRVPDWIRRRL